MIKRIISTIYSMKKLLLFALLLLVSSAIHAQDTSHISANAVPEFGGTVEGAGTYHNGETRELKANANENYEFRYWNDSVTDNPRQITVLCDSTFTAYFFLMLPEVGDITSPDAICANEPLVLSEPEVLHQFDTAYWQLSENDSFEKPIVYHGGNLDASYNGWKLRYCVSNGSGVSYSNIVTITVFEFSPTLHGDEQVCSNEESEYSVDGVNNAACQWTASNDNFKVTGEGNPFKVRWATNSGPAQLSVIVSDTLTGCNDTLRMEVNVTSDFASAETLIERRKDGKIYMLIYPNPDSLLYKYQWYYNDSLLAHNQQYLYKPISEGGLATGTYKVYISFNEEEDGHLTCGAFSPEFIIRYITPQLSIYPNPSHPNGKTTIINEEAGEAILYIYSMDGRLLHQQSVEGREATISLDLPRGIYNARLVGGQSTKTGRFVIE